MRKARANELPKRVALQAPDHVTRNRVCTCAVTIWAAATGSSNDARPPDALYSDVPHEEGHKDKANQSWLRSGRAKAVEWEGCRERKQRKVCRNIAPMLFTVGWLLANGTHTRTKPEIIHYQTIHTQTTAASEASLTLVARLQSEQALASSHISNASAHYCCCDSDSTGRWDGGRRLRAKGASGGIFIHY